MFANTYPKLSEVDLDAVEQRLGVALPDDLRDIYLQFNGGRPLRNVFRSASEEYDIQQFLAMKYADDNSSFEGTYEDLAKGNQFFPKGMIPFAVDDAGDYFLYSTRPESFGSIWFNQSDYINDPNRFLVRLAESLNAFLSALREAERKE
ncbi:MAG TPA: SMI1/KNR4 family protein [Vitreimonas sp.]|jgi:hypothetical protein|nr:SMI1/KNR4 family protein [Vitreimonas sp.]